jgi:hypothetical protein
MLQQLTTTAHTLRHLEWEVGFAPTSNAKYPQELDLATTMNAELLRDSLSFIETRMPAAFLCVYRFATLAENLEFSTASLD